MQADARVRVALQESDGFCDPRPDYYDASPGKYAPIQGFRESDIRGMAAAKVVASDKDADFGRVRGLASPVGRFLCSGWRRYRQECQK